MNCAVFAEFAHISVSLEFTVEERIHYSRCLWENAVTSFKEMIPSQMTAVILALHQYKLIV